MYWPEVISNKDLWIRTGQEPIITTIKRMRWKWIGHTLRKGERNSAPCDGLESVRKTYGNVAGPELRGAEASRRT